MGNLCKKVSPSSNKALTLEDTSKVITKSSGEVI